MSEWEAQETQSVCQRPKERERMENGKYRLATWHHHWTFYLNAYGKSYKNTEPNSSSNEIECYADDNSIWKWNITQTKLRNGWIIKSNRVDRSLICWDVPKTFNNNNNKNTIAMTLNSIYTYKQTHARKMNKIWKYTANEPKRDEKPSKRFMRKF